MGHFVLSAISHYLPHSVVHSFSELNFRLISLRDGEAHCFSKQLQNLPSVRTFILWLANNLFLPLPSNEFSFTLVLLCVVCFNAPSSNSHQWSIIENSIKRFKSENGKLKGTVTTYFCRWLMMSSSVCCVPLNGHFPITSITVTFQWHVPFSTLLRVAVTQDRVSDAQWHLFSRPRGPQSVTRFTWVWLSTLRRRAQSHCLVVYCFQTNWMT